MAGREDRHIDSERTHPPRATDIGWRKYAPLYPWIAGIVVVMAFVFRMEGQIAANATDVISNDKRDDRQQTQIQKNAGQLQQLKLQTTVIQTTQERVQDDVKEVKGDVKTILREIQRLQR